MTSDQSQNNSNLQTRPPVVAVLGHVDHGKSSLIEAIRSDFVITSKESGGITQHIGAYEAQIKGKTITFIDTPGHEAFSALRQRGADIADVALLVIDAGEGVKPQTKEALKFIQTAKAPLIVVFNKIDKPDADVEKVKGQLSKESIVVESWGGRVPSCNVSSKEKQGIEELLETILIVAEMENLQADFSARPEGIIIESSLDAQKGPLTTLILQQGVLHLGDFIATHFAFGRVKGLYNFKGEPIKQATPSQPVSVLGFDEPPGVGEKVKKHNSLEEAKAAMKKKERTPPAFWTVKEGVKALNIILKTDFLGSQEAVENILKALPQEKVVLRVLKSEVGPIDLGDVKLAQSGKSCVFGFRVKVEESALGFAEQRKILIKNFDIIYELAQEVRRQMGNVLAPEITRVDLAKFKVTHIFKQAKQYQVVGGKVLEGEFTRQVRADIFRDEEEIGRVRIRGMQKEKQEIGKAQKGQEIGLEIEGDALLQENDVLKIFREDKSKGTL